MGIIGDHEEGRFLVLSFYSPYVENEIKDFVVNQICEQLLQLGEELPQFLLIGGDTNTVFTKLDKEGGTKIFKTKAIHAFEELQTKFDLFDTYRVKNPFQQKFSWEKLNPSIVRERIDVIFASNNLQDYVKETGIIPPYKSCSDHGIPYLRIMGHGVPSRGTGIWKFNNSLLNEQEFVQEMEKQIPSWIAEAEREKTC